MNEFSANNKDLAKTEAIRRQYLNKGENKMELLKKLDSKVKAPGRIVSTTIGTIGTLTMGAGMSLIMVWSDMTYGLALGIVGMLATLLAYPIYTLITRKRKKQYAEEIIQLSDKVVNN